MYLLVNSHSIESIIHNIDPAILGSQNKEGHQSLQHKKQSRCGAGASGRQEKKYCGFML